MAKITFEKRIKSQQKRLEELYGDFSPDLKEEERLEGFLNKAFANKQGKADWYGITKNNRALNVRLIESVEIIKEGKQNEI